MSCGCGQTSTLTGICPCDTFVHPQIIFNPPGRTLLTYRVGDYLTFRHALLQARAGESELANWRPGAQGDLAVQMIEWWAYVADVLTFYNERIANQYYLRTADLPESVRRLIRILGYRPRPGIGATATLAAIMSGTKALTLPAGFPVQSKPGPGKQPQIFELDAATLVQLPDTIAADPVPDPALFGTGGTSVLVQGVATAKAGDQLLLMERGWTGTNQNYAAVTVQTVTPEKDPRGKTNTRITFTAAPALSSPQAAGYRLMRSAQSARVWQYPATTVIQASQVDLEAILRSFKAGDPVLVSLPDATKKLQLVSVTAYSEAVWYANPSGPPYNPTLPPTGSPTPIAIPIPHSLIQFQPALAGFTDTAAERQSSLVEFAWQDVGTLIPTPSTTFTGTQVSLTTALPASVLPMSALPLLIAGGDGNGITAEGSASSAAPTTLGLSNVGDPTANVVAPLQVLFDLLQVSRGKTVTNEILGSGDATVNVGQEFTLQKSPLTYLMSGTAASGTGYQSTLKVWVDGVEWKEVPSFYGQPSTAKVFVTREDDQNMTHVQFGEGVNGSRLPSGVNNVVASYRYGSGAESPDPGSLNVILQPWPGLKSLLNPVAAGGGADPDPPQQIKRYAPQSALTFGRAISASDYTTIAAQAPGVSRARSYFVWDAAQERMLIKVYVGDDISAVTNANTALADASDPNRPLQVLQATALPITLSFTLLVDPLFQTDTVKTAVTSALTDPDNGLLGANAVRIGQIIYRSQIEKACLTVPGTVAVHDLSFRRNLNFVPLFSRRFARFGRARQVFRRPFADFRYDPGEGSFFQLAATDLTITPEVAGNAG
jgi:hypothetical protein